MTVVSDYTAILAYLDDDNARWNATHNLGFPVFVSYSFLSGSDLPSTADAGYPVSGVQAMSAAQQAAVRSAIAQIEAVCGVRFVETTGGEAMVNAYSVVGSAFGGWAEYPYASASFTSTGIFAIDVTDGDKVAGDGRTTLLHELGHALGLSHTFEGDLTLATGLDSHSFTVMSYTWESYPVTTLGPLDISALKHLYGEPGPITGLTYGYSGTGLFTVTGTSAADRIMGVGTDNLLKGGGGKDILAGREGNDTLLGGGGNDVLFGHGGVDVLKGGKGNDRLYSHTPQDTFIYDPGQHRMEGGLGDDRIYGGNGTDTMLGGNGADTLRGGKGNDLLIGGKGVDKLFGQAGGDTFRFDPARDGERDTVMDFDIRSDHLVFDGPRLDYEDFGFRALASGSGTILTVDTGAAEPFKVLFRDVTTADLDLYFNLYHAYF